MPMQTSVEVPNDEQRTVMRYLGHRFPQALEKCLPVLKRFATMRRVNIADPHLATLHSDSECDHAWKVDAPDVRAEDVDAGWRIPSFGVEDPRFAEVGLDPCTSLNLAGDDPQERRCAFRQ